MSWTSVELYIKNMETDSHKIETAKSIATNMRGEELLDLLVASKNLEFIYFTAAHVDLIPDGYVLPDLIRIDKSLQNNQVPFSNRKIRELTMNIMLNVDYTKHMTINLRGCVIENLHIVSLITFPLPKFDNGVIQNLHVTSYDFAIYDDYTFPELEILYIYHSPLTDQLLKAIKKSKIQQVGLVKPRPANEWMIEDEKKEVEVVHNFGPDCFVCHDKKGDKGMVLEFSQATKEEVCVGLLNEYMGIIIKKLNRVKMIK
jgi:hypothetical protein